MVFDSSNLSYQDKKKQEENDCKHFTRLHAQKLKFLIHNFNSTVNHI